MKRHKYISEDVEWKTVAGEPPINSPGDLLAMMVNSGKQQEAVREGEQDADAKLPRKAIISINGKDVEECLIPSTKKPRAA